MNKPTNSNQFIPILGRLIENGEVEYIGSAFLVRWFRESYLCTTGHTFTSEDYSGYYYSIDNTHIEIPLGDLNFRANNVDLGQEGVDRLGRKDDYAFLKIATEVKGLTLMNDELEYGEALEFKGFSPIIENGIAYGATYVENKGIHDSDEKFGYTGVRTDTGRNLKMRMDNIRIALFDDDCIKGNSGGAILKDGTNEVVGFLTNGLDETYVYIISDYIMDKLIELYG